MAEEANANPGERTLVERACRGDSEAFDALVTPHLARAYRTAYLITHNGDAAADALQEALLRSYRSLRNLQADRPFSPWFARIVVNEALKQARRQRRLALPLVEEAIPVHAAGLAPHETPEGFVQAREERERLWRAIQRLSPAHRAVIVLRYYEELSEAEMAAVLNIRPGTVKSRLFHARAALERLLGGSAGGVGPGDSRRDEGKGERRSPVYPCLRPAVRGGESHE